LKTNKRRAAWDGLSVHGARTYAGRIYKLVNEGVYLGRLPRPKFEFMHMDSFATVCKTKRRATITIHVCLLWRGKLVLRELIHEIVHVARPRLKHGPRFWGEMMRVSRFLHKRLGYNSIW
jgi:hypothetical protein